ncbi:uncharacterized protein LOC120341364 isoform X3 [Styela clava]
MFCPTEELITSGSPSEPGKWPWQALIITELDGKWQQCGGSLITPSWVLTAAHCFLDPVGNNWKIQRITLGTINRNGIGKGAVNYTKASIVHVHEESIPDVLQEVDVNIFSDEACRKMHHTPGPDGSYTKSHFCAGHLEGKKDTCGGDSGGPLMCEENGEYIVHGITSSGPAECGKKNKPGIYTRVSDFITWIGRTIYGFRYHWSNWKRNKCSVTCGRGQRTVTRTCLDKDDRPATECEGISIRHFRCRIPPCVEYHWTHWKTTCSVTCNKGIATIARYCADANNAPTFPNNCPGREKKIKPCVMPKCIEYHWTTWVSTCNVACGEGTETSSRDCMDDKNSQSKAENCVGESRKIRKCVKPDCIEYHWTPWVSTCSVTCGEGTESSTRNCVDDKGDQSKPDNCPGEDKLIGKCVKPYCIEYHWGEWFNASECSASCGTGEIKMKRKCFDSDNFEVLDSNKCNPGKDVKLRTCNLKSCPEESSTSYHWGQWGSWSTCRSRVGHGNICNGFKSSTRDCLIGSEDVNTRRCRDEYYGEDHYCESSCRMKTSYCP